MQTNTRKKRITVILAIAVAAVMTIGGTLAYLATLTGQAENTFTFAENVKARLDEPNWNPKDGENLIPGAEIRKDPMITNVSNNGVNEYAALRINFTDGSGDLLSDTSGDTNYVGRLLALLDIDWNTTDWALADSGMAGKAEQVWVYKHELAPGEVTNPLFSSVTIKSSVSGMTDAEWGEEFAWLASICMTHTDDCYKYGTHDAGKCTVTYKHHKSCAVYGKTGAENTAKGGTLTIGLDDFICDCSPVEVHDAECPKSIGTIDCAEATHVGEGIDGFQIIVKGAVVQAGVDGMGKPFDTTDAAAIAASDATIASLLALFTANPYV